MEPKENKPMREDKIRFHYIHFDWMKEVVYIKYIVGTQTDGGYEDNSTLTFETFSKLVDTKQLQSYLSKNA